MLNKFESHPKKCSNTYIHIPARNFADMELQFNFNS